MTLSLNASASTTARRPVLTVLPCYDSNKNVSLETRFWRLFVKRYVVCCQRQLSVCPVLCVCDVDVLWPNGWMDQDGTWHGGGPRSRPYCARWGPSFPSRKKGAQPPIFGPFLLWPKGWMHQDATWYGGRPQPRRRCVRWGPSSPSLKGTAPNFQPMSLWPNGWMDKCHLVCR